MRNTYNANSSDLRVNFTTELEDSFLEPLLFAIRLFLPYSSRTSPLHHMLSISTAKEIEMVQAGSSFLLCVQQVPGRSKWHLTKQTYSTGNEGKHTKNLQKQTSVMGFTQTATEQQYGWALWICSMLLSYPNSPVMGRNRKTYSFCVLPWVGWKFFITSLVSVNLMAREPILCLLRPCVLVVKDYSLLLPCSFCNLFFIISPLIYTAVPSHPFLIPAFCSAPPCTLVLLLSFFL